MCLTHIVHVCCLTIIVASQNLIEIRFAFLETGGDLILESRVFGCI